MNPLILTHSIRLSNGLEITVLGPIPPRDFIDDGCTKSPDMWWRPACRIHDYEYQQARDIRVEAKKARRSKENSFHHSDEWWGWRVEYRRLRSKAAHVRRTADYNLGENMRRVARGLGMTGIKGKFTRIASWIYVRAVRILGAYTVRRKGHKGNVQGM